MSCSRISKIYHAIVCSSRNQGSGSKLKNSLFKLCSLLSPFLFPIILETSRPFRSTNTLQVQKRFHCLKLKRKTNKQKGLYFYQTSRYLATVWTSLSPLPLKFNTTLLPSGNVGHSFSRWASAWEVSSAGMIPSNRDTLLNATNQNEHRMWDMKTTEHFYNTEQKAIHYLPTLLRPLR